MIASDAQAALDAEPGTLDAGLADATPPGLVATPVAERYAAAPGWNDYVVNDGASPFEASGAPCPIGIGGGYDACVHSGEIRFFDITGLAVSEAADRSQFGWRLGLKRKRCASA